MKCSELISILQQQAPEHYACGWDNCGLLVGSREKEIKTVYIALDATDEAVDEAVSAGADFLLTHHPLIFKGMKHITDEDFIGRRVMALIRADISYYAMHTNFDVMGMADLAASRLGLMECVPLEVTSMEDGIPKGIGCAGNLQEEIPLEELCRRTKCAFGLGQVKVFGKLTKKVKRVAACPGAGRGTVDEAVASGADVYITGDIDHHTGIDALAQGMAIIDAGHYGIEHIFIQYMQQYLKDHATGIIALAQEREDPFSVI